MLRSKSIYAHTSLIALFSIPMSRFASQSLNKHLHCNQMIFLQGFLSLSSDKNLKIFLSQNAVYVTASFSHWLKLHMW